MRLRTVEIGNADSVKRKIAAQRGNHFARLFVTRRARIAQDLQRVFIIHAEGDSDYEKIALDVLRTQKRRVLALEDVRVR